MSVKQKWDFKSPKGQKLALKKSLHLISIIILIGCYLVLFGSCGVALYTPAILGSDISYQPKPMTIDSIKSNTYLTAIYSVGGGKNIEDEQVFTELNFSRAHAFKNLNLSYGAYGFLGSYSNGILTPQDAYYFRTKSFGGYGFRASANYVMPLGRTEFRFPGIELGYSKELGEYADFRQQVLHQPGFYVNPHTQLISIGGSAEVIWHQRKYTYNRFSFRLFIGKSPRNNEYQTSTDSYYDNSLSNVINWSFMFQHKRVSFAYEASGSLKLGMIYSFK